MIHNREVFLNPAYLASIVGFVLQHATCFSLKAYRTNHKLKYLVKGLVDPGQNFVPGFQNLLFVCVDIL